jgi:hypothetical protein
MINGAWCHLRLSLKIEPRVQDLFSERQLKKIDTERQEIWTIS